MQKVKVKNHSVQEIEWKQTDRQMDGRTDGRTEAIANALGKYSRCLVYIPQYAVTLVTSAFISIELVRLPSVL